MHAAGAHGWWSPAWQAVWPFSWVASFCPVLDRLWLTSVWILTLLLLEGPAPHGRADVTAVLIGMQAPALCPAFNSPLYQETPTLGRGRSTIQQGLGEEHPRGSQLAHALPTSSPLPHLGQDVHRVLGPLTVRPGIADSDWLWSVSVVLFFN